MKILKNSSSKYYFFYLARPSRNKVSNFRHYIQQNLFSIVDRNCVSGRPHQIKINIIGLFESFHTLKKVKIKKNHTLRPKWKILWSWVHTVIEYLWYRLHDIIRRTKTNSKIKSWAFHKEVTHYRDI